MTTPNPPTPEPAPRGFPFVTVVFTLAAFFGFVGLMLIAYKNPSVLEEPKVEVDAKGDPKDKPEPKVDPATKLSELRARNQAALDGVGSKMSVEAAQKQLLEKLKSEKDRLPFPQPEPPVTATPDPKKK